MLQAKEPRGFYVDLTPLLFYDFLENIRAYLGGPFFVL